MENLFLQSDYNIKSTKVSDPERKYYLALFIWPLAFMYSAMLFEYPISQKAAFGIFVAGFIFFGEILYHKRKSSAESKAILIMLLLMFVSAIFEIGHVFDLYEKIALIHLYAVYWILCRSDKLLAGKTSSLFLIDGFSGFFIHPFANFPLVFKDIISLKKEKSRGEKIRFAKAVPAILASMIGMILFIIVGNLLVSADRNFRLAIFWILPHFHVPSPDASLVLELIIMLPVACYLYGLFQGCSRFEEETRIRKVEAVDRFIGHLSKVPEKVWMIFILLFSLLYFSFFLLQGSYLFDAFIMVLPDQYTYSEYARSGFGNMIGTVFINFILLWLITKTSRVSNSIRHQKAASILLAAESLIFSLIASLKLYMYIHAYGFTPLRLQSAWLCMIVILACLCIIYHVITEKESFRFCFYFSAGTLALLTIL